MGTLVRSGRGVGVVIATGTDTEFGIIFSMMQDVSQGHDHIILLLIRKNRLKNGGHPFN